jgi:predicted ATP-binding protein involved in virulence
MRNEPFILKLKHLILKNFRGFEDFNITFDEQLTILIADNGGGKTTILDSIAANLRYIVAGIEHQATKNPFDNSDILFGKDNLACHLYFYNTLEPFELSTTFRENRENNSYYAEGEKEVKNENDQDITLGLDQVLSELHDNDQRNLPIIAYYPCQLASVVGRENGHLDIRNRFATYEHCLDNEVMNFNVLRKWFIRQNMMENNGEATNPIFKVIKEAIIGKNGILNDDDSNRFTDLKIGMKHSSEGNFLLTKEDTQLYDFQLSSGEKSLMLLVADLARRVAMATPFSSEPLKDATGVVLIDEIDLHLHPSWQVNVVTKLKNIFPNIQFIITTHSPVVLSGVRSDHIRRIKDKQVYGVSDTLGHPFGEILEDSMDTIPNNKTDIEQLFDLITENDIPKAQQLLRILEKQIEGNHTDIQKAKMLIQKKSLLKS